MLRGARRADAAGAKRTGVRRDGVRRADVRRGSVRRAGARRAGGECAGAKRAGARRAVRVVRCEACNMRRAVLDMRTRWHAYSQYKAIFYSNNEMQRT